MRIFVVKKNTLIRAAVFVLLIIGAIVYTQLALSDARPVSSSTPEMMPICRVDTKEKAVALTIDTAFGDADYTQEILDVLDSESAKATFFVMGLWANQNAKALDAIAKSGNEIANHSMNHTRYPDLTSEEVIADANAAKKLIFDKTGFDTFIIRMPYGAFDDKTIATLKEEYIPSSGAWTPRTGGLRRGEDCGQCAAVSKTAHHHVPEQCLRRPRRFPPCTGAARAV